jgi:excisionase family DNA binding protein
LTTVEAGEILGCSARTVRELCETGKLAASKTGPIWLISWETMRAFKSLDRKPYWYRNAKTLDKTPAVGGIVGA